MSILKPGSPRLLPTTIAVMVLLLLARAAVLAKDAGAALGINAAAPQFTGPDVRNDCRPPSGAIPPGSAAASPPAATPEAGSNPTAQGDSERTLLQDLRRRREELDRRDKALAERGVVLEALSDRLQAKMGQLSELQADMAKLETARRQRAQESWTGLVTIYQSMKPQDAATIFDSLDMHVLLEVLDRMNERKAASILAAMQPDRARQATQMLAEIRTQRDTLTPAPTAAN